MNKEAIWSAVLEGFQGEFQENVFQKFIATLQPKSLVENKIIPDTYTMNLEAPSALEKGGVETIKTQFEKLFRGFAYNKTQKLIDPNIVVRPLQTIETTPEIIVDKDPGIQTTTNNQQSSGLNANFTFNSFVEGRGNSLALNFSKIVSENPGTQYNPLLIYGGVGLGKTHLMQAIGNAIQEKFPEKRILFTRTENFLNDYIQASTASKLHANQNSAEKMAEFRKKYRSVDVLLVDDVQFFHEHHISSQEEFFNVFQDLTALGKQIVITSDRQPKEIKGIDERLISRFSQGISSDIQKPDYETRIGILRSKAEEYHLQLSDDIINLIAEKIDSNVRVLEGAINNISAIVQQIDGPISISMVQDALDALGIAAKKEITIPNIQQTVADWFMLTVNDLIGPKRDKLVMLPRQIAMFLSRKLTDASLPAIGRSFGNRDHTTVMHGTEKINDLLETDNELKQVIDELTIKING